MKNKIKHIRAFSLWLAFMVVFFHAVIPHRQHLNTGYEQCGTTEKDSGNTPVSCQLFRNNSFDKPQDNPVNHEEHVTHQSTALKKEEDFDVADKTRAETLLSNAFEARIAGFFRENIPVRGSPLTS